MTSSSDSIDISLSGVYRSWYAFRAGKRQSRSIITFEYHLENNLDQIAKDLQNNQYRHGSYVHLVVQESKRRSIAVAHVRDRVVHRLLYDYFVPRMDSHFDYDVWSCRQNKGLQQAIIRSQELMKRHPDSWVWRGDVSKFFDSVNHKTLKTIVRRCINDRTTLEILDEVISSYSSNPGTGIAIGNLTSQILSNVYLNEFDRYARHELKPLAYLRYGDDFIMFFPSRVKTVEAQKLGTTFLKSELQLTIHKHNNVIVKVRDGLHFLGVRLFVNGMKIQPHTWQRMKSRINEVNYSSYRGFTNNVGSKAQKKSILWQNIGH